MVKVLRNPLDRLAPSSDRNPYFLVYCLKSIIRFSSDVHSTRSAGTRLTTPSRFVPSSKHSHQIASVRTFQLRPKPWPQFSRADLARSAPTPTPAASLPTGISSAGGRLRRFSGNGPQFGCQEAAASPYSACGELPTVFSIFSNSRRLKRDGGGHFNCSRRQRGNNRTTPGGAITCYLLRTFTLKNGSLWPPY
jgi:hypothetical protein